MELHTAAIAGVITVALSIGGSWMTTKTDVAVNSTEITHIKDSLLRIEKKIDNLKE